MCHLQSVWWRVISREIMFNSLRPGSAWGGRERSDCSQVRKSRWVSAPASFPLCLNRTGVCFPRLWCGERPVVYKDLRRSLYAFRRFVSDEHVIHGRFDMHFWSKPAAVVVCCFLDFPPLVVYFWEFCQHANSSQSESSVRKTFLLWPMSDAHVLTGFVLLHFGSFRSMLWKVKQETGRKMQQFRI